MEMQPEYAKKHREEGEAFGQENQTDIQHKSPDIKENEGTDAEDIATYTSDHRDGRLRRLPRVNYKAMIVNSSSDQIVKPKSYQEAMQLPESCKWKAAMQEEIDTIRQMDAFDIVALPQGAKAIPSKWHYTVKRDSD